MLKAFILPSYGTQLILTLAVLLGFAGCNSDTPQNSYSIPEPRVASYEAGAWTIQQRPTDIGDKFSTINSIFATGSQGWPVALRDVDGTLTFGEWDGSDWQSTTIVPDPPIDMPVAGDGDQLYSGVMVVAPDGNPHALFVTNAQHLYYAGRSKTDDGNAKWTVSEVTSAELSCYDLAVGRDGVPRLLYADAVNEAAAMATPDANGSLISTQIAGFDVCGSIAVSDGGKIGAVLWIPNAEATAFTAAYFERLVDGSTWSRVDIATDGNATCSYCYIPEIAFRGDEVPVVEYVDNQGAVYLAAQAANGTFGRDQLAAPGQKFQLTRLKRSPDGTLGTAVILDGTNVGLAVSSPPTVAEDGSSSDGFIYSKVWSGVQANTPRLTFAMAGDATVHPFISFWDMDGLYAVPPGGTGGHVDTEANLGFLLGGFVAIGPDGVPQVFYNEIHETD